MTRLEKLADLLVQMLGLDPGEITPSADFVNDLGADSLDCIEIIMECEERFDIYISDEDADRIRTVQDALSYLDREIKP